MTFPTRLYAIAGWRARTCELALENGRGTMINFKYIDGEAVLPDAEKVKALRPAAN
jgi:hypothetical protein